MIDFSLKPTGTLVANADVASKEVPLFVRSVNAALAAVPQAALTAGNTVTVQPGNRTFSTIAEAMNSITDAGLQKQYVVQIGPGTYNEVVVCKPYVFLQGAGAEQTIITAPGATGQINDKGTVKASSNAALQNMTILSVGSGWGNWATAVDCNHAVNFDIENCVLEADGDGGVNLVTLSVDYSTIGGGSQINVAYTTIRANGSGQPVAILLYSGAYVHVTDSKILAGNANTAWGASASFSSTLDLYNSFVQGTMSLVLSDSSAKITATDCQLVGPYSPGVVINTSP